jgi:hypothetical protein
MATVIASTPNTSIIGQFTVLKDFEHKHKSGGISGYMKNAKYNIRANNDELIANVKKWRKAGKVL